MSDNYANSHWLYADDSGQDDSAGYDDVERMSQEADQTALGASQNPAAAPVGNADSLDEADESDEMLLAFTAGHLPLTEPPRPAAEEPSATPVANVRPSTFDASMTGPLTRRLAAVNATRPLRAAPVTLRLPDVARQLAEQVSASDLQRPLRGKTQRRPGCSLITTLLALLCISSIAALIWGVAPSQPPTTSAHIGGTEIVRKPSSTRTASATASASAGRGISPTPGATFAPTQSPVRIINPTEITQTPTLSPNSTSATITFAPASQTLSSLATMSACPSGCAISAKVDTPSRSFLHSQHTSGGRAYWAVDLLFTTGSSGHVGNITPYGSVNGVTVACQNAPFPVNLSGGQSAWFQCVPTVISVPAFAFNCSTCFGFSYANPSGSYQDTSNEYVTQQDCSSALSAAQGQATTWEASYVPNAGPQLVAVTTWTDSLSCSPAVNQHGTTVTGYAWGHVGAEGFNPPDAKTAALAILNAELPTGDVWKSSGTSSSAVSCTPTWTIPAGGSTTFTVACQATDQAIKVWTTTAEQQLVSSLTGLTLVQAVQLCDGITQSTCQITLTGGNGQTLPSVSSSISVSVT